MRVGDRYVLGDRAGGGAMGAVHRATDANGRRVAAKRLLDIRNAARFEIEARLLTKLSHPRVVRVLDFTDDPAGRFLIMEWVDGEDLAALLAREGTPGLPADRVLELAVQAAEALRYIHDQQVVHRDVKPQNLMLAPGRGVVLVDFGIARDLDAAPAGTWEIGTPGFMAPEAYVGGPFSPRTDVFGLAATVWTLLAGAPPRLGQRGGPPGVDASIAEALAAALEPDPQERLASIAELAALLGGELGPERGRHLAHALRGAPARRALLEAVVRTAAGVFDAAAASLALLRADGGLVYTASWGAGSEEILGVELAPGAGISGGVVRSGRGEVVANCRSDPRFELQVAQRTGYVPHTMIAVPLRDAAERPLGALNVLDRRDGRPYDVEDLARAELFAALAVAAVGGGAEAPTLS